MKKLFTTLITCDATRIAHAFCVMALTLSPITATADVSTVGTFNSPTPGTAVTTGIGTSNFSYGTGSPTGLRFNGISQPGVLPTGRFTVGTVTLSNGVINSGGATGVELLVTATDTGSTDPGQEEIIVSVFDGMVLRLESGALQQVDLRAQSFGPGFCGVEGELAGGSYGFLAPPIVWSRWIPIGPGIVGGSWTLTFRPICDTDAIAQVRYFPELRSASGIANLSFINTTNTDDPIESADSFCMVFDSSPRCAWVKENQSSTFTLVGRLGSLEFVDLLPSPSDEGFVTDGTDPKTNIVIGVSIDVKPRNSKNVIDLEDDDKVTVAILTASDFPTFDAAAVVVSSLRLGLGATAKQAKFKDVDKDGDQDLRVKFRIDETGIECGNTLVTLTGATVDGLQFSATDSITTKCDDDDDDDGDSDDDSDEY